MTAKYFPKQKRGTVNAVIQSSTNIAFGLTSLSILIIEQLGWRQLYNLMGVFCALLGAAALLFIKEPPRNIAKFELKK